MLVLLISTQIKNCKKGKCKIRSINNTNLNFILFPDLAQNGVLFLNLTNKQKGGNLNNKYSVRMMVLCKCKANQLIIIIIDHTTEDLILLNIQQIFEVLKIMVE